MALRHNVPASGSTMRFIPRSMIAEEFALLCGRGKQQFPYWMSEPLCSRMATGVLVDADRQTLSGLLLRYGATIPWPYNRPKVIAAFARDQVCHGILFAGQDEVEFGPADFVRAHSLGRRIALVSVRCRRRRAGRAARRGRRRDPEIRGISHGCSTTSYGRAPATERGGPAAAPVWWPAASSGCPIAAGLEVIGWNIWRRAGGLAQGDVRVLMEPAMCNQGRSHRRRVSRGCAQSLHAAAHPGVDDGASAAFDCPRGAQALFG